MKKNKLQTKKTTSSRHVAILKYVVIFKYRCFLSPVFIYVPCF